MKLSVDDKDEDDRKQRGQRGLHRVTSPASGAQKPLGAGGGQWVGHQKPVHGTKMAADKQTEDNRL